MANANGTPVWFELTTADPGAAQDFYGKVIGWRVAPSPVPEHGGYRIADAADGTSVAGLMAPPPGMAGVPGWVVYFAADDVDAMAARIAALGGAVHFGPMDIPHVGRFATVADPQGIVFTVMKGSSPEESAAFRQAPGGAPGHGVWIELASPDPDAALAFYGQLFGWSRQGAMPMGAMGDYTFIGTGDDFRPGAVMSSTATGAPPRWNMYFEVADIDAALAAARAAGGRVLQEPTPIPGGSFSANIADAQGHPVGLVGPRTH